MSLPTADSLLAGVAQVGRSLSVLEGRLLAAHFLASSADGAVTATVSFRFSLERAPGQAPSLHGESPPPRTPGRAG